MINIDVLSVDRTFARLVALSPVVTKIVVFAGAVREDLDEDSMYLLGGNALGVLMEVVIAL